MSFLTHLKESFPGLRPDRILSLQLDQCIGGEVKRLSLVVSKHVELLEEFADKFWDYFSALQRYRDGLTRAEADRLRGEFGQLFSVRTDDTSFDDRIAKMAAKKDELLTVLSHPEVPLHNNASELGARVSARRRDTSLHSKSLRGAQALDVFTTLVKMCKKLSVVAYAYLWDRLSLR